MYIFRFNSHVNHCNGLFKKNYITVLHSNVKHCNGVVKNNSFICSITTLLKKQLLFCLHILNNHFYAYCLAYDLIWKLNIYYMTYDFETKKKTIEKSIFESTIINSSLIPLSVASYAKLSKGLNNENFWSIVFFFPTFSIVAYF